MKFRKAISHLDNKHQVAFALYVILASFFTYSCIYAFRKPFTAAMFSDMVFWGIQYKILLVSSQIAGYTLSKFIGIKVISEMKSERRAPMILGAVAVALFSLFLFGITPAPYNIIFMFFNGLPLGIIWGLVFSYLEGRRTTEILGAGLCISFIFSSGFVKSIGKYLMLGLGISELWMPFLTALVFTIPLIGSVWLLNQIPAPGEKDVRLRMGRQPMTKRDRAEFLKNYAPVIIPFILVFVFLSVIRDVRDTFAAEIYDSLGLGSSASVFTVTEIPVSLGVLICISLVALIRNNFRAFNVSVLMVVFGLSLNILSTIAFYNGMIGGLFWMISIGFGLYLGYVAFHALIFERLIAAFQTSGNIGFLFYLADSFGYLGSVASFLMKNFFNPGQSWLSFFTSLTLFLSIVGLIISVISILIIHYFYQQREYLQTVKLNI